VPGSTHLCFIQGLPRNAVGDPHLSDGCGARRGAAGGAADAHALADPRVGRQLQLVLVSDLQAGGQV
jgi:hypothetical protein